MPTLTDVLGLAFFFAVFALLALFAAVIGDGLRNCDHRYVDGVLLVAVVEFVVLLFLYVGRRR